MNIKTKLTLLAVVIAMVGPFSPAQLQAQAQNGRRISESLNPSYISSSLREAVTAQDGARRAIRGDIASGLVLETARRELRLNIKPCGGPSVVVVFHEPYTRSTRGQKNCGGQNVTIEQIQQN